MSVTMTYSQLIEDVKQYAERFDQPFIAQVPRFIALAENRIASEVRGLGYLRYANGSFNVSDGVIEKPSRWRETSSWFYIKDGQVVFLKQRGYSYVRSYWPDSTQTGDPEYYCDYDYEHFLVVPSPSAPLSFELAFYERPLPLSESNQTNWTTQYAPQLLLYAALLEAQPFLKRPERIAEFQALFDRAAAAVGNEAQRRLGGDQTLLRTTG
jgi:hypothetical protein